MAQGEIRFDGRAILITGAGRGMGRTHALLLASRGAKVVVADNGAAMDGAGPDSAPAAAVVAEIVAAGGEAVASTADIATIEGSNAAVAASLDAFGRIDGILHNASTAPNLFPPDRLSDHDLELVMRVNGFAALWMARAAWPHMARQGYGRIVLTTSGAALYGALGNAAYSTAKSGYIGMLRTLAAEGAGTGIQVNVVSPTAYTRMTERLPPSDYARWYAETMQPEKMSVGVAYLLSDDCPVSGQIFYMGGGHISRVVIAESEGVIGTGGSIEAVRDAMPAIMADTAFFHAKDQMERSARVGVKLGYQGNLDASVYATKDIVKN